MDLEMKNVTFMNVFTSFGNESFRFLTGSTVQNSSQFLSVLLPQS
jgi:hypothetical protein